MRLLLLLAAALAAGPINVDDAERVTLPTAQVKDGKATLALELEFPEGWKLNPEAPLRYSIGGKKAKTLKNPGSPVIIPVRIGKTDRGIELALVLNYCRKDGKGVCKIKTVLLEQPLEVIANGPKTVALKYSTD